MSITKEQLEDHIKNGLVSDIFKMERAYALLRKISDNAGLVNKRDNGNYGELFGSLQHALETEAVLAVARLYDNPNKRYPTRCVKGLLAFLGENKNDLPEIVVKHNVRLQLANMEAPEYVIESLESSDADFTESFVTYYTSVLDNDDNKEIVNRLKTIRDKALAHNEMTSQLNGPTWEGLTKLINLSKNLAGVIGWAYLSTAYMHNGEYFLTSDAEQSSRALNRLLQKVYTDEEIN